MPVTITTNNQPRNLFYGYDLTKKEYISCRKDFDYFTSSELLNNVFFKYQKRIYSIADFISLNSLNSHPFKGWDGYHGDTYFSGTIIRLVGDWHVTVGRYYS